MTWLVAQEADVSWRGIAWLHGCVGGRGSEIRVLDAERLGRSILRKLSGSRPLELGHGRLDGWGQGWWLLEALLVTVLVLALLTATSGGSTPSAALSKGRFAAAAVTGRLSRFDACFCSGSSFDEVIVVAQRFVLQLFGDLPAEQMVVDEGDQIHLTLQTANDAVVVIDDPLVCAQVEVSGPEAMDLHEDSMERCVSVHVGRVRVVPGDFAHRPDGRGDPCDWLLLLLFLVLLALQRSGGTSRS